MASKLTIGQLAKAADVPTSTIRYYERRELLVSGNRSTGNYRLYGEPAVERLQFIKAAQATGFTLDDIRTLLDVQDGAEAPCEEVQVLIQQRIADVQVRMNELRRVERVLKRSLQLCRTDARSKSCVVIEKLSGKALVIAHVVERLKCRNG